MSGRDDALRTNLLRYIEGVEAAPMREPWQRACERLARFVRDERDALLAALAPTPDAAPASEALLHLSRLAHNVEEASDVPAWVVGEVLAISAMLDAPKPAAETGSADDRLWALHIEGPDDVVPAPSRELAQQAADLFNATFPKSDDPNWPRAHAAVIEWPHGSREHALASLHFVDNWITPTTIRGSATPTQDAAHGGRG